MDSFEVSLFNTLLARWHMDRGSVEIVANGARYVGTYIVERGYLTVTTNFESLTTNVTGLAFAQVEAAAKMLLGELVTKGKARPVPSE